MAKKPRRSREIAARSFPSWITEASESDEQKLREEISGFDDAVAERFSEELTVNILSLLPCISPDVNEKILPVLILRWVWLRCFGDEFARLRSSDQESSKTSGKKLRRVQSALQEILGFYGDVSLNSVRMKVKYMPFEASLIRNKALFFIRYIKDTIIMLKIVDQQIEENKVKSRKQPGPKHQREIVSGIRALADLYEYATGRPATRTYNPLDKVTTSDFVSFVRACLKAYDPSGTPRLDWFIRQALEKDEFGADRRPKRRRTSP